MRKKSKRQSSRFPISLFAVYLGVLLLMSGIHTGVIVLMNVLGWNEIIQMFIPIVYWSFVAIGVTLFTRYKIEKTYDEPLKRFAQATKLVANGDFSVYVSPLHTVDKQDYLDLMISDFNKMVEELGSIETLKIDFFSNVSHEIKTPLFVIQSNAELMQKNNLSDEERKEYSQTILQATRRLSGLITNMLKLNKLEKQTIKPQADRFDVAKQLCECALQFEDVWEAKEIEFIPEIDDIAYIYSDEGLLELVWTNLLSNAFKFTPKNGTVTLSQISKKGYIIVEVTDTGCGMDSETAKHVFDKFYQGDTSHYTEGNGLGMALVHRILELLNGSITVQSKVKVGTTFTVRLPLSLEMEEA